MEEWQRERRTITFENMHTKSLFVDGLANMAVVEWGFFFYYILKKCEVLVLKMVEWINK